MQCVHITRNSNMRPTSGDACVDISPLCRAAWSTQQFGALLRLAHVIFGCLRDPQTLQTGGHGYPVNELTRPVAVPSQHQPRPSDARVKPGRPVGRPVKKADGLEP
jgi:hypothetical protein